MKDLINRVKNITKQPEVYEDEVVGVRLLNIKGEEVLYLKRFDNNTWIIDKDNKKVGDIVKLELETIKD